MHKNIQKYWKYLKFLALLLCFSLAIPFSSCSKDSQFSTKLTSSSFIAELYGSTTKTLSINTSSDSNVAWVGLAWSGDYKYFEIDEVLLDGETIATNEDGSQEVYEDISVSPSTSSSGTVESETSGQLTFKVTYSPLAAIEADDQPHQAHLLLAYDAPNTGIVRIELNGYTSGICDDEVDDCNSVSTDLDIREYTLSQDGDGDGVGDLTLYLCDDPLIPSVGQDNDTTYAATNVAYVNIEESFYFYFNSSGSEMHISRSDSQGLLPTVPDFLIPVPPGNYDGVTIGDDFTLESALTDGQDIICTVTDGNFDCTGVELTVGGGLVGMTPLQVTNGTIIPESADCSSFADGVTGSGSLDDTAMTLVAWAYVNSSNNVPSLLDALVVVSIPLEEVE